MSRPMVTVYNEMSVDGRITDFARDGELYYRHGFTMPRDAILMGSTTAQAFGPRESDGEAAGPGPSIDPAPVPPGFEDLVEAARPVLVVVDSGGAVRNWRHAQAQPWYGGFVGLVSERTPTDHRAYLARRDVDVLESGSDRVDLAEGLQRLHDEYGIRRVRTDGGGRLTGALLASGLVDRMVVMVAPALCEVAHGRALVDVHDRLPRSAARLALDAVERLEAGVVVLTYSIPRADR